MHDHRVDFVFTVAGGDCCGFMVHRAYAFALLIRDPSWRIP